MFEGFVRAIPDARRIGWKSLIKAIRGRVKDEIVNGTVEPSSEKGKGRSIRRRHWWTIFLRTEFAMELSGLIGPGLNQPPR